MEGRLSAAAMQGMGDVFEEMLSSLSTLHSLGQVDVQGIDEQALLRQALRALVEHAGVECCSIFLCQGDELVNAAGLDWRNLQDNAPAPPSCRPAKRYLVTESFMGLAVRTGRVQVCSDCRTDPRFRLFHDTSAKAPGSVMSAPVKSCGRIIGVLNISHPEKGHFNEWHIRLVAIFSDFLGQIITSSRLLRKLEDEVGLRTRQLEEALAETRQLKGHYQNLALVDPLTGLFNRRHFFTESRLALSLAVRYGRPFSLIIMDLDRFKQVNDRFGHLQGDRVLTDIARTFQAQLRDADIFARIGGEEFALALAESSRPGAADAGRRLLEALRSLRWECDGQEVRLTVSAGMVHLPAGTQIAKEQEIDVDTLLDRLYFQADRSMYEAKRQGGDRLVESPFF